MTRKTSSKVTAFALCASTALMPNLAAADDIDIFTGASAGKSGNPRILIVLDNTSNWSRQSQQWPGGAQQGQSEASAIQNLVKTLDQKTSVGLMEFVTGGSANDDGGFVRAHLQPMEATPKQNLIDRLATIYANVTQPDEKHNANTPYGNLMYDVYNYLGGLNSYSPAGVIADKADRDAYTSAFGTFKSPLSATEMCSKTFLIFIGNPNASGPTADSAANTTRLKELTNNRDVLNNLLPVTQLGLPNISTANVTSASQVGVTAACYAASSSAAVELSNYSNQCAAFTEGCSVGAATANTAPIACAVGSRAYSVVQSVYHPATSTPGQPVQGTVTSTDGKTTGYYSAASAVPASDKGGMSCPATQTTSTSTTTYSCSYTLGAAVGSATPVNSGPNQTTACYTGVGTATGNWNPATSSDHAGLTCPANSSCSYSGVLASNSTGCGNNRKVLITQSATPYQQYALKQTVTPTTVSSTVTAAYTDSTTLGLTAQCYSSGPATTSDYAASCSGTNVSCSYNNTPTSATLASCPAGTSAYKIVGTNIELTNVPGNTFTTDSATYNADEWARLMHDQGIPVANSSTKASVTTYTIDVYNKQPNAVQTSLLMSMAKAGQGKYFVAKNEQAILDALEKIVIEIQAVNSTFASTSLPVNATNRSQNENQVFIGMFRPDPVARPRWFGNLKRYQLINTGSSIELGDVNAQSAVNTLTGFVTPCATSYWTGDSGAYWDGMSLNPDPAGTCTVGGFNKYSDAPDGPLVEKGAAAQVLRQGNVGGPAGSNHAVNRNMYTLSGTSLVAFDTTSSGLDANLVKYIRGEDVNNEKATGELTTTRPSIHGDVIHSRPLPINYGAGKGVTVYYGANDGTLRAVNAESGVERWSFVAPEFFGRLARIKDNSPLVIYPKTNYAPSDTPAPKDYFFDGSTGIYQNADSSKVWIYASMRRGGRMLYALDVSDPALPVFKWKAGCPNLANDTGCSAGMSGIGQTWSTPNIAFIKGYSTTVPVIVVGGGYDGCEDANTASPACSGKKGGFIYILDGDTGALIRAFDTDRAVAGDVSLVDINNDGMPDYAYAADTGGNLYRINFVASASSVLPLAGDAWTKRKVAFTNNSGRKFLFAPALLAASATKGANPNRVYVAIGSGDREHPLADHYPFAGVVNRFYVYKDKLDALVADPAIDLDALDRRTASTDCTAVPVLPASTLNGWYMDLNQYGAGEQVVTTALIAGGMVTFSTNRPIAADAGTCSSSLGEARGYWVNLFNASGAINVAGACGGRRSSVFVGGGLPPSPVMASSVPIGKEMVTVVIGAVQKGGIGADGASVAIAPQRIRPTINYKRKRAYTYTSGD